MAHQRAVIGSRVEVLRRAAVALHDTQGGIARIDRGAAQFQQICEQVRQQLWSGRFDFQAQVRGLAIGAAYAELFHFEAAMVLDHFVEDVLHHVGIDQMALRFDHFL